MSWSVTRREALSLALAAPLATRAAAVFDVRQFGAAGDGRVKDTTAVASAIAACAKAGGGTVSFPPGAYLCGAIRLRDHVTLDLDSGAVILASTDPADYPDVPAAWDPKRTERSAFIYGRGLTRVAIRGRGAIDGQGRAWWDRFRQDARLSRPHLVKLVECRGVDIEGVTLRHAASWNLHPLFCDDVTIRGIRIEAPADSPNTDGIDPESCRNVRITGCTFDVGDDCVVIKSGRDEMGRRVGRPCEDIVVADCVMLRGRAAVAVGSEMSGGVKNVVVSNCVFHGTLRGIRIKTERGRGGVVEGLVAGNIVMEDVAEPFSITCYYHGKEQPAQAVGEGTPRLREILLHDITVRGARLAGQVLGLPEMPIDGVSLTNVRIRAEKPFQTIWTNRLALRDVSIECAAAGPVFSARGVAGFAADGFRAGGPGPWMELDQVTDARLPDALRAQVRWRR
jgi:polygalacturonase